MSTVSPSVVRSLASAVRARGADILDAPVSGSVSLAAAGQLSLMIGGEPPTLERVRPVLEALAARMTHVGQLGSGATVKLCVNTIIFGLNQSVAEALVLAERAGVDRATAYDVFLNSAIAAPFVRYKEGAFVDPASAPVAFSVELAIKDLGLVGARAGRCIDAPGARRPGAVSGRGGRDAGRRRRGPVPGRRISAAIARRNQPSARAP